MKLIKKISIKKVVFLYFVYSLILIWFFNKALYFLAYFSIKSSVVNEKLLFNLTWSAYFIIGVVSIFLGAKIASAILKKHYEKNDEKTILHGSALTFLMLTGFAFLLNLLKYNKIDSNILFAFCSFVVVNFLYYYASKIYLKK